MIRLIRAVALAALFNVAFFGLPWLACPLSASCAAHNKPPAILSHLAVSIGMIQPEPHHIQVAGAR